MDPVDDGIVVSMLMDFHIEPRSNQAAKERKLAFSGVLRRETEEKEKEAATQPHSGVIGELINLFLGQNSRALGLEKA